MRTVIRCPVVILAAALTAVAQAGCGPGSESSNPEPQTTPPDARAVNVKVSDQDRGEIAAAFARRCQDAGRADCAEATRGPLYAARLGRRFYAFAAFRFPEREAPGQPELFRKRVGEAWVDHGPTDGRICVPRAVADVWDLRRAPGTDCYLPPPAVAPRNDRDERRAYSASVVDAIAGLRTWWPNALLTEFGVQRPESPEVRGPYTSAEDAPTCGGSRLSLRNAAYCPPDDFIAWDEPGLMLPMYRQLGPAAPTLVLAHEWGHAMHSRLGWTFQAPVLEELSADCLAGAWMRTTSSQQSLSDRELDNAANTLFSLRDTKDRPWLDPAKHGAGYQRIHAFGQGVNRGPKACAPEAMAQAFPQSPPSNTTPGQTAPTPPTAPTTVTPPPATAAPSTPTPPPPAPTTQTGP